ncbi:hypothetical protein GRAN_5106 [Granulicella sibirica]|uniref:Uncharacterized protein n=1 Tax=Granulicella sibirica TaxID=2479048 RepID=A0A4Q0SW29_9BACT|nr:hypothetical protein GRAN_5106 [Granulicella sibirica]
MTFRGTFHQFVHLNFVLQARQVAHLPRAEVCSYARYLPNVVVCFDRRLKQMDFRARQGARSQQHGALHNASAVLAELGPEKFAPIFVRVSDEHTVR